MKKKFRNIFLSSLFLFSGQAIIYLQISNNQKNQQYNLEDSNKTNVITDQNIKKGYQFDEGEAAAVTTDQNGYDHLYMWGDNSNYQLGLPYINSYSKSDNIQNENINKRNYYYIPTEVNYIKEQKGRIEDLKSTKYNTILTFVDQEQNYHLYIYGSNINGLLTKQDLSLNSKNSPIIIDIPSNLKIADIELTDDNAYLLLDEKTGDKQYLYSWGKNDYGQLGLGYSDNKIHKNPTVSKYINGKTNENLYVNSIYAENDALYLLVQNSNENEYQTIYSLGSNKNGQLGLNSSNYDGKNPVPTEIPFFAREKAQEIIFIDGNNHQGMYTEFIENDQTYLVGWGNNNRKQLINIDDKNIDQPTAIFDQEQNFIIGDKGDPLFDSNTNQLLLSDFGYEQSYLILEEGTLIDEKFNVERIVIEGWGLNAHNSLGGNNVGQINEPIEINSFLIENYNGYQIKNISTGSHSTDILIENNQQNQNLYTWGYNQTGQLGNGEEATFASPTTSNLFLSMQTSKEVISNNIAYQLSLAIFIVIIIILILVLISLYLSIRRYRKVSWSVQTQKNEDELKEQELVKELTTQNLDLNLD
ncbi:Regulator of chromosome condensation (RCC1) repeat protein [Candidatus Hepatoplasma crinochetorum Av]|uniref:Regulator of chromosome condensation (RCC1) repeat protein n=1 Tax=Candidatus Hepatoplasma crinochetorum Av TaxID=1427984 RepID=W8GEU8_9MOLU|nr:RCC1 domain-containing protein [Candidatus Hepatoplasma crinochetorum]AHK22314.1 Regulator of chromosome condensation (RCC1) repeat protein [Candidatus Hepatoplasma crinochetorum Av]